MPLILYKQYNIENTEGHLKEWNHKLVSIVLIVMFASTDKSYAKDVMEEIGNKEKVLFHKTEMALKMDLQIIENVQLMLSITLVKDEPH